MASFCVKDTNGNPIYYAVIDYDAKTVEVVKGGTGIEGSIVIPKTVTYDSTKYTVTAIDISAFHDCDELISVSMPNSITSIGDGAFQGCSNMTSVSIGSSVVMGQRKSSVHELKMKVRKC